MREIDISKLVNDKKLSETMKMTIKCYTPLSIAVNVPGRIMNTSILPNDFQLMGLIENILGIYITKEIRKTICKDYNLHMESHVNGFKPIIQKSIVFKCLNEDEIFKSSYKFYDFQGTLSKSITIRALKGVGGMSNKTTEWDEYIAEMLKKLNCVNLAQFNAEYSIKDASTSKAKNKDKIKTLDLQIQKDLRRLMLTGLPIFNRTITKREYVQYDTDDSSLYYEIKCNTYLKTILSEALKVNRSGYLGNTDGIVDVFLTNKD